MKTLVPNGKANGRMNGSASCVLLNPDEHAAAEQLAGELQTLLADLARSLARMVRDLTAERGGDQQARAWEDWIDSRIRDLERERDVQALATAPWNR